MAVVWAPIGRNGLKPSRSGPEQHASLPVLEQYGPTGTSSSRYHGPRLFVEDSQFSQWRLFQDQGIRATVQDGTAVPGSAAKSSSFEPPSRCFRPFLPLQSNDGEEFLSYDLDGPWGFLDLIRPNEQAGLRFPITKPEGHENRPRRQVGRHCPATSRVGERPPPPVAALAQIRHDHGTFHHRRPQQP